MGRGRSALAAAAGEVPVVSLGVLTRRVTFASPAIGLAAEPESVRRHFQLPFVPATAASQADARAAVHHGGGHERHALEGAALRTSSGEFPNGRPRLAIHSTFVFFKSDAVIARPY